MTTTMTDHHDIESRLRALAAEDNAAAAAAELPPVEELIARAATLPDDEKAAIIAEVEEGDRRLAEALATQPNPLDQAGHLLRQALQFVRDGEWEGDTTWERDVEAFLRRIGDIPPGLVEVVAAKRAEIVEGGLVPAGWVIDHAQIPDRATLEVEVAQTLAADGGAFRPRMFRVAAIQWRGTNWPQVKAFLIEYLGEQCNPRNTWEQARLAGEDEQDDNLVLFDAWDSDQEIDGFYWIVVYLDGTGDGEIMSADDFRARFEPDPTS